MAILWERSIVPWIDETGAPYAGAKVYFFDGGTTTPMITYTDPSLSIPHDHPVVANSAGMFPAIFLEEEVTYKFRVTDSDDALISEVDGVSAPTSTPPEFPDSDTPAEKTITTGKIIMAWQAAAPNGFVRLNGRTIGAAASGAAERANADCEDLFVYLWDNDSNLSVSGGRGSTADGDWAANKTIALPDFRGRVLAAPDTFGSSAAGRITDALLGADSDTLGSAGGSATHTLTLAELPADPPTGSVAITDPGHKHHIIADANGGTVTADNQFTKTRSSSGDTSFSAGGSDTAATLGLTSENETGVTAAFTGDNLGDGDPHANLQPTIIVPFFIKL